MKYLFLIAVFAMVGASFFTWSINPEIQSKVPIIYWVTDPNPARVVQVETFQSWLRENKYPEMELRVDAANLSGNKRLIQGVSGVGDDVFDHCGDASMRFFQKVGLLTDVTDWGKELHFDPSQTYAVMEPSLTVDGRQYAFPSNVACNMLWVNLKTFERFGVKPPPERMSFAEFEAEGKVFCAAANKGLNLPQYFFSNGGRQQEMWRSMGVDTYNETLTGLALDDPRAVDVLNLIYKWTYVDHILPTAADVQSFSSQSGYGGATFQLFNSGNFATVTSGRYALIQFRQFLDSKGEGMRLAVVEHPNGGFPNEIAMTRASAIYADGKHQELAKYFLAYLASKAYNMTIVEDADALPPNPKYTTTDEFLYPAKYPNEWGTDPVTHRKWSLHETFAHTIQTIGIPLTSSPFVLDSVCDRITKDAFDKFMNNKESAAEALKGMRDRVELEIQRNLTEQPDLKPAYDKAIALQQQIDAARKAGEKVPLAWIANPFYRKYYQAKGWCK